eukprot:270751-Amphidinium_carterae.2
MIRSVRQASGVPGSGGAVYSLWPNIAAPFHRWQHSKAKVNWSRPEVGKNADKPVAFINWCLELHLHKVLRFAEIHAQPKRQRDQSKNK